MGDSLGHATSGSNSTSQELRSGSSTAKFEFSSENFKDPKLPAGLRVLDVPLVPENQTEEALRQLGGRLISALDEVAVEKGNFEIVK